MSSWGRRGQEPLLPTTHSSGADESSQAASRPPVEDDAQEHDAASETPPAPPSEPSPREIVRVNLLAIEDSVAIMRRDAEHAERTSYTAGMRARLAECRADIARRVEDSKHLMGVAETRSSGSGARRQVEVAKLQAGLERVIQKFNGQNKLCIGAISHAARARALSSSSVPCHCRAWVCLLLRTALRILAGLERRPVARRPVGSGIGPDPCTSDSSCGSDLRSTMSPLSLGSPALAPSDQIQQVRRLDSLLGSQHTSRGSSSSARWWNGFVRSPRGSSGSSLTSRGDAEDQQQQRRCCCCCCPGPAVCACMAMLLAVVLGGLLLWQLGDLRVLADDITGANSTGIGTGTGTGSGIARAHGHPLLDIDMASSLQAAASLQDQRHAAGT